MAKGGWKCPYCGQRQVVTSNNSNNSTIILGVGPNVIGENPGFGWRAIACLNEECQNITLSINLFGNIQRGNSGYRFDESIRNWRLLPESQAVPQPDYIPSVLVDDYYEACRIVDLSPKASATLIRRCLQGMIRDFCGISEKSLYHEIDKLRNMDRDDKLPRGVTPESVEAIDHVRKIGNIGAHMEADISLVIEIDPDEADVLIKLVETLFQEWYVARHERHLRFAELASIRERKDAAKASPAAEGATEKAESADEGGPARES